MRTLTALLVAITAAGVLAVADPVGATTSPLRYVAMGDSYSAASGNVPPDPTASPACLRSTVNYPHLIASKLHTQLTDVTCGAADTSHYFAAQYQGVAPQLDAVQHDTQLVTMTIGGNDSGVFINAIVECGAAGLSTLGQGSPCKDKYGSSFEDTIRTKTYPSLVTALKAVRAKAPHARVSILGYPWILPATGGCFPQMPIASGDVAYLRHMQATLNDAVQRAANATGATYVSLNTVSDGHDACQAVGTRWVEPVLLGTNPVIVHPNALGESQLAAQALRTLHLA